MRSPQLMKTPRRSVSSKGLFAAWSIVICVGSLGVVTQSQAQQLLPADRVEIADQERLGWTLQKLPPQPYMNEIYWQTPVIPRHSFVIPSCNTLPGHTT